MKRVLVVGATGTVGSAAAEALALRHAVIRISRSSTPGVDANDPKSIEQLFQDVGPLDAVVTCIGTTPFRSLAELTREDYEAAFNGKALSQIDFVRIGLPYLQEGGSFTLTSGILAETPIATGAAASLANGAIEAFVRAAAAELPRGLRINAVSPNVIVEATDYHDSFPGFIPVPADVVAKAYVRSVDGVQSGETFRVH